MEKLVLSLVLALVINALVTVGAAVAALDAFPARSGPADLIVSSTALKPADFIAIRNDLSGLADMSPIASRPEPVNFGSAQTSVTVDGVQANFAQLAAWQVDEGRFFTSQDETALDPVAVVSHGILPNARVGDTIRISDVPFTIVGIGRSPRLANVILVPFRTGQIRLFGPSTVDGMFLQIGSATQSASVSGEIEALLRTRHNLRAGQADDFTISGLPLDAASGTQLTGMRVLRAIEQFVCSAKNSCARMGVS